MKEKHYQSLSGRVLHTALGQVLQLVGNLELKRAAPTVSHERNFVRKIEHHASQVPDLRMVRRAKGNGLPSVLGVVHPPGDLRNVVANSVERALHGMQRLGQLGIRRSHTTHIPDDIAQRLTPVPDARLFQLFIEQREVRRRHTTDHRFGPATPLDLYLPHELRTAIDRANGDAILARQDFRADTFAHLFGDGLAGCVIESAGHLSQM